MEMNMTETKINIAVDSHETEALEEARTEKNYELKTKVFLESFSLPFPVLLQLYVHIWKHLISI